VSYELAEDASTSTGPELGQLFAADRLAAAVARGTINLRATRLVWVLRVQGISCAEVPPRAACA